MSTEPCRRHRVTKKTRERPLVANYQETFGARGHLYNEAGALCPRAREVERSLLVERLPARPGEVVCDAPAGGGYLAEGLREAGFEVVCVEPAAEFAGDLSERFQTIICPLTEFDLPDESVNHLASLAGLHHLEAPRRFFEEAFRVVRPGGWLAVADVQDGTRVARFLNGPVDRLSETGHAGLFFTEGSLRAHLEGAGFGEVEIRLEEFAWSFPDKNTMLAFCWKLFGLTGTSPAALESILAESLGFDCSEGNCRLNWSLLYARGQKMG